MSRARNLFSVEVLESRRLLSAVVEPYQTTPTSMFVESDGHILVTDSSKVYCFNADGSVDASFGDNGIVTPGFTVAGVAVQGDGKIVVGGSAAGGWAIARYNANGGIDTTFGSGTGQTITQVDGYTQVPSAIGVAVEDNGDIIVGGSQKTRDDQGGTTDFAAICFDSDGSVNPSFGVDGEAITDYQSAFSDFNEQVSHSMTELPNGDIVIAGLEVFDDSIAAAAYFSPTGQLLNSPNLDDAFYGSAQSVACDPFNTVAYAAEQYSSGGRLEVGDADTQFLFDPISNPASQYPTGLTFTSSDNIIAVGIDPKGIGLAQFTSGGRLDPTFGTDGSYVLTPHMLGLSGTPTADGIAESQQINNNYIVDGVTASGNLFLANIAPPPSSYCNPASITHHGQRYTFMVQFSDQNKIDLASLSDDNIVINGPHGLRQRARLVSVRGKHNVVDVFYSVNFDRSDSHHSVHAMSIELQSNQVFDNLGDAFAPGTLAEIDLDYGN